MKTKPNKLTLFNIHLLAVISFGFCQPTVAQIPTFTKTTIDAGNNIGGVAWMDYDGDGFLDLAVANGVCSPGGRNALFRNNRDGSFTRATSGPLATDLGYSLSVAWGDYDNDGLPDLFFGGASCSDTAVASFLYHNVDGDFQRITNGSLPNITGSFVAVWGDYDRDGLLDIFLANTPGTNFLFHNNGNGSFSSVDVPMSRPGPNGVSFNGATWADFDNDGYPDLFMFNSGGHNLLFHNDRNGTFSQVHGAPFDTDPAQSVGAAWGDYDNDGFVDLFVTNGSFDSVARHNNLYHNNGNGTFTKVTTGNIVTDGGAYVTAAWEDFDNDGNLDLFVSQNPGGVGGKNRLYHNNGDGTFTSVMNSVLVAESGNFSGVAWGDIDNDGFPDLFVAGSGQPSALYHNQGNSNPWIGFKLIGSASNRSAIGAKVRVKATIRGKTYWQMREVSNGDGFSGNSLNPHFGLGDATNVDTVRIEWPSGTVQTLTNLPAQQYLTVFEPGTAAVQTWAMPYNNDGEGGEGGEGHAVALDAQGNVVVTGWMSTNGVKLVMVTAKYAAASGTLLWERRFELPTGSAAGTAVAVDRKGNVVVAGSGWGAPFSAIVVKYSADGAVMWEQPYSSGVQPPPGVSTIELLVLDPDDNVLVAGELCGWYSWQPRCSFTAKFAATNGTPLWQNQIDGGLDAIGCDTNGNLLVAGVALSCSVAGCTNPDVKDVFTVKYASQDGRQLWAAHRAAPYADWNDGTPGLAVAENGDVAVLEAYRGTTKYAGTDGHLLWEQPSHTSVVPAGSSSHRLGIDSAGNVMLLGLSPGTLFKYASSDGAVLWKIPLTSRRRDTLLAVDDAGNALVAESDSSLPNTFRTAKYAGSSGALLWESVPLGIFPPSNGGYYGTALATGRNGTAAAILNFLGTFVTVAYQDRLPPLSIQVVKEGVRIGFRGSPSTSYQLNRADAIGGPWSLIATFTSAADGTAEYLDARTISGQFFYRVSSSSLSGRK